MGGVSTMIRSLLGLLVVTGVLLPGTVLAGPGPPRPEPTPHANGRLLPDEFPPPAVQP